LWVLIENGGGGCWKDGNCQFSDKRHYSIPISTRWPRWDRQSYDILGILDSYAIKPLHRTMQGFLYWLAFFSSTQACGDGFQKGLKLVSFSSVSKA
jgi:hypothetical protein